MWIKNDSFHSTNLKSWFVSNKLFVDTICFLQQRIDSRYSFLAIIITFYGINSTTRSSR